MWQELTLIKKSSSLVFSILILNNCIQSEIKETFQTALKNPYGGNGSTVRVYTCGYPLNSEFKTKTLNIDLTPMSDLSHGSGYADIELIPEKYLCNGKLFFTYSKGYGGGHGAGDSFIRFGSFERENKVDPKISQNPLSVELKFDEEVKKELSEIDPKLPDGSFSHFYWIDLKDADNGIIFDLTSDQMLEGAMYKDGKFIEFSSMVGYRFKKGKLYLLLTNGRDRAKYNLKLRKLDEKERLNRLEPKI